MRAARICLLAPVVALCCPLASVAQTNERTYEAIEFRVQTPGARAVAMGKTFVGIADDATAVASNPAGLANLLEREVSLEWTGTTQRQARMVTAQPLTTQTTAITFGYPSFASFVTPAASSGTFQDFTVGVFYSSLQATREAFNLPNQLNGQLTTEGGYRGHINLRGHSAGIGASWLVHRKLSIGAAVSWRHIVNHTTSDTYSGSNANDVRNGSVTDDSAGALAGYVGVLAKPKPWLFVGASFQPGTTLTLRTRIHGVFCPEGCPGSNRERDVSTFIDPNQDIEYRFPTRATLGVAVRPNQSVTVLSDIALVRYSERITPRFLIVDFLGQPSAGLTRSLYTLDDAVEVRVGFEHRLLWRGRVFAWRTGVFMDPDHQMRFDLDRSNGSPVALGQHRRFNSYRPGAAYGVAGGGGLVFSNRFQFDGAFSISRKATELVLSTVIRFPA